MLEQLVVLLRRHPIVLKVPLSEVVPGNKMIAPGTQAQILRMCDVSAVKHQARPGGIMRTRRQWRPTAMAVGVSPRDPGRAPNLVWRPAPAQVAVAKPAAVMERCPAPGIIRTPIPPTVCPDPAATIVVRCPARVDHHGGRLPACTITGHIDPIAI